MAAVRKLDDCGARQEGQPLDGNFVAVELVVQRAMSRAVSSVDQPVNGNLVAIGLVIQRGMCDMSTRLTLYYCLKTRRGPCAI